jgi:hypothetical protein
MMKYSDAFIPYPSYFKEIANPKRFWIDHYPFWGSFMDLPRFPYVL